MSNNHVAQIEKSNDIKMPGAPIIKPFRGTQITDAEIR